jgi:hypothetical protein
MWILIRIAMIASWAHQQHPRPEPITRGMKKRKASGLEITSLGLTLDPHSTEDVSCGEVCSLLIA